MKTTKSKPKPAPRRKVNVNFVSVQESTPAPQTQKALRRAASIARAVNARARPRTITNTSTDRNYAGAELKPYIGRPGAQHAQTLPSRIGSRLRHPDGRITDLSGNLLSSRSLS